MIEEEREKAAGRARVAHDSIGVNEIEMKEAEQKALADIALSDFAAKEGIALDGTDALPSAKPQRSLGPHTE